MKDKTIQEQMEELLLKQQKVKTDVKAGAGGYYDFPHTRNYDSDLGFLINKYIELGNDYNTLIDIYNLVQQDIKDITISQLQAWLDDGTLSSLLTRISYVNVLPDIKEDDFTYMLEENIVEKNIDFKPSLTNSELQNSISTDFIVASFNFLATNYWQYGDGDYYLDMMKGYRSIVDNNITIAGINEYNDAKYYNNDYKLKNILHPYMYKNTFLTVGKGGVKIGDALLSSVVGTNITTKKYSDDSSGNGYGYVHGLFNIKNKTISIYATHLTPKTKIKTTQLAELVTDLQNDSNEYKIVIGDLNIDYLTEFNLLDPILNTGLVSVNTTKITLNNGIVDYILVSQNIKYSDVKVIDTGASDHKMVVAKLEV